MGGTERFVFVAPSLAQGKDGALEYIGTIPYKKPIMLLTMHISIIPMVPIKAHGM